MSDPLDRDAKDAARWRFFSSLPCSEQRWMCACADKDYSGNDTTLDELVDAAMEKTP